MEGGHGAGDYKDLVVFLAAAGVVVPLFSRFKISPILGFLAAGVLLGPDGLGRFAQGDNWASYLTITDRSQVQVLAELGVAFLLFTIGLELSWERLKSLRRLVFGLGMAQVALCSVLLTVIFMMIGQPLAGAAVAGMALALSSTAVVMPVLAERGRLKGVSGRSTFAVLLAQDLAVAPILITVTVLASIALTGAASAGEIDPAVLGGALLTLVPAAIGIAVIIVVGRLVLRPMFRSVARAPGRELFLAACLLVVVGTGVAAQAVGLTMSVGALLAGLLLAETEYRREVEVSIEPFKGLLLGVFFVSVGIGLDLDILADRPTLILLLALGSTLLKIGVIFGLCRAFGLSARAGIETALVLGPAGEFAFVILAAGLVEGVASPGFTSSVMVAATLSMLTVPLMAAIAERLTRRAAAPPEEPAPVQPLAIEPEERGVLIVGFGRVGRLVGEMLAEHGQGFLAIDSDPRTVAEARRQGHAIYYGDAGNIEMLARCGIDDARALVVTMDAPDKVDQVVVAARAAHDDLVIIARARDDHHAERLYGLGVTDAVPETTEASLQLAENTLVDLGVPMGLVLASVHERRDKFRAVFQAAMPDDRRKRRARALRSASTVRPAEPTG